jgi:DNA-3-methyladenine glycosylase II
MAIDLAERQRAFDHLLEIANSKAPALLPHLDALGVIDIAPTPHASVADQLFVEVINQQLSIRAADTIWSRVRAVADERALPLRDLFSAEYGPLLRGCGVSGRKVRALIAVREAELAGIIETASLGAMTHDQRAERLVTIWGIGRWTADMIGIFHFHDPDIWPSGDVAVVGTFQRFAGAHDPHTLAAHFAPYRSFLARYLWRMRDMVPAN